MARKVHRVVFICSVVLSLAGIVSSLVQDNSFRSVTDCVCPRDVVSFECTVCGLATAWEGTALDSCSGREIALTNRDFIEPIQTIICNGGAISARGISVEDGCFTSQLNITLNATFQDTTVSCSVDNGIHASEVGRDVLTLSRDSYPALVLEGVYLAEVSPTGLLFSWNQTLNCPSLRYNISSDNCGSCPNITNSMSVNCSDFTLSTSITLCTFAVQAVICGNNGTPLIGNISDSVIVNLTVPAIGQVTTIPHYHIDNGLRSLTVTFSAVEPFIISEGINGTADSYMVYYSDSNTGAICGSNEPFCGNGICRGELDISSSLCRPSSDINVTVSAVTNLGEGPQTNPIMEEYLNNFVRVQVISESVSINCTFLNVPNETPKSCNATITYGQTCQEQVPLYGMEDSDNNILVVISLREFLGETDSPIICGFRVNATANTKTATVDGNLLAISVNNPSSRSVIIAAALVPIVILMLVIFFIILAFSLYIRFYFKVRQRSVDIHLQSKDTKFKIISVPNDCNMIKFAKENFDNYDPDSGRGYYQFIKGTEEYISPKTQVALASEDMRQICTDLKVRKIIGMSDKRERIKLPDLSNSEWKYVFIQSTSRIQTLPKGSLFMYYLLSDDLETKRQKASLKLGDENLKVVEHKYKKLKQVPGDGEYPILEFVKTVEGLSHYKPGLGYGFYEFTKPELISYDKQVILMDQNDELHYGPTARRMIGIGPGQSYDESKEFEPNFDRKQWRRAFIQTRSNVRKLQPNTWFLYCDVASSEMVKVLEPFELFPVNEDGQKLIKFAKEKVTCYNPWGGYGYYEFTEPGYVLSKRNIMVLKKNGELFTGPGVRHLICATGDYDETEMINPPDLSDTEWDCIFIQGKRAYGRLLVKNTWFLYCEYDYRLEDY